MMPLRVHSIAGLVLAGLALSGCGNGGSTSSISSAAFSPTNAEFALSEASAGPITPNTPYSTSALEQLFPGFRFDTVQTMADGRVTHLLAGFDGDGFQAFQVEAKPGRKAIASVQVVGPAVRGPRGETIGMTFDEAGGRRMKCEAGRAQWTGLALCSAGHSNLEFIFAPEQYLGPSGKLPSGDELHSARLVRMVWRPS